MSKLDCGCSECDPLGRVVLAGQGLGAPYSSYPSLKTAAHAGTSCDKAAGAGALVGVAGGRGGGAQEKGPRFVTAYGAVYEPNGNPWTGIYRTGNFQSVEGEWVKQKVWLYAEAWLKPTNCKGPPDTWVAWHTVEVFRVWNNATAPPSKKVIGINPGANNRLFSWKDKGTGKTVVSGKTKQATDKHWFLFPTSSACNICKLKVYFATEWQHGCDLLDKHNRGYVLDPQLGYINIRTVVQGKGCLKLVKTSKDVYYVDSIHDNRRGGGREVWGHFKDSMWPCKSQPQYGGFTYGYSICPCTVPSPPTPTTPPPTPPPPTTTPPTPPPTTPGTPPPPPPPTTPGVPPPVPPPGTNPPPPTTQPPSPSPRATGSAVTEGHPAQSHGPPTALPPGLHGPMPPGATPVSPNTPKPPAGTAPPQKVELGPMGPLPHEPWKHPPVPQNPPKEGRPLNLISSPEASAPATSETEAVIAVPSLSYVPDEYALNAWPWEIPQTLGPWRPSDAVPPGVRSTARPDQTE